MDWYFFTSVPDEIKSLAFPLKNNPDLTRESAWAHLAALGVKSGIEVHGTSILTQELNQIRSCYKSFDRISALKQLDSLHVVSSEIISSAIEQLQQES